MKSIERKLDERFRINIEVDSTGFYVIFKFNLLDNLQNKSVFDEKYTKPCSDSYSIKSHLRKSENDFTKKSKEVIEFITAMETVFD